MHDTQLFEIPIEVRKRAGRIKEMIKKYKQKYSKIAVVAHYNTINFTVCKKFNELNEPEDSADVHNCEIYPTTL